MQIQSYHAACQLISAGNKHSERYLKHIATQVVTCHLLAHTYTVIKARTPLVSFVVDVLYKQVCKKNTQEIELIELEP